MSTRRRQEPELRRNGPAGQSQLTATRAETRSWPACRHWWQSAIWRPTCISLRCDLAARSARPLAYLAVCTPMRPRKALKQLHAGVGRMACLNREWTAMSAAARRLRCTAMSTSPCPANRSWAALGGAKVDRAVELVAELETASHAFLQSHPYAATSEFDSRTNEVSFVVLSTHCVPNRLAAIAADAIHNLR